MTKKMFFILLLVLYLSGCRPAVAEDFKNKAVPTHVNIEVGKVTEIVFPEKVSKIIKGGQGDAILVEVLGHSIYVLPKTEKPPDIFVTTTDEESYPLQFHLSQEHDIRVYVSAAKPRSSSLTQGSYGDVMDLMKELLLNREPAGATVLPAVGKLLLSNQNIQIKVEKAYELLDYKAYVLRACNLASQAVIFPIEQLSLPGLLAISANRDMLSAKGEEGDQTRVYLIVGQSHG